MQSSLAPRLRTVVLTSVFALTILAIPFAAPSIVLGSKPAAQLPPTPNATSGVNLSGAQKFLLKRLGSVKFKAAGPAFNIKKITKPVWLVAATLAESPDPQVVQGFVQAAKAAGVPYHVCPGESTTQANALCLRQATQAKAGSAIIWSENIASLAQPLKQARAAGVKIVSGNDAVRIGEKVPSAVDAEVSHDYFGGGQEAGAYAVAARGSALDALCISIPEFAVTGAVCSGFETEMRTFCAACKYVEKSVPAAQLPTGTGATVSRQALQDPKLNFIMGSVDAVNPFVETELKLLRKTPKQIMVGGLNGTVAALQSIRSRSYEVVSAGQNAYWWGWAFFDAGARVQVGAIHRAQVTQPNKLFTRETFHYSGPISYNSADQVFGFGNGSNYKKGYEALWK